MREFRWIEVEDHAPFLDEHAVREGHRTMWLFTDEDNDAATALYEATGGQHSPHTDAGYRWLLDQAVTR